MELRTQLSIAAPPARVWAVFSEFDRWPEWNPFVTRAEGDFTRVGNQVRITAGGQSFRPTITAYEAGRLLRWRGKLFLGGIFSGEHSFRLVDNGDGTTTFHQDEDFGGLLLPLLRKKLNTETRAGFNAANLALRERVEEQLGPGKLVI